MINVINNNPLAHPELESFFRRYYMTVLEISFFWLQLLGIGIFVFFWIVVYWAFFYGIPKYIEKHRDYVDF